MDSRAVRSAVACVAIGVVLPALAQAFECRTPALQNHPLAERATTLSSFEQGFGGDFLALIDEWRRERDTEVRN